MKTVLLATATLAAFLISLWVVVRRFRRGGRHRVSLTVIAAAKAVAELVQIWFGGCWITRQLASRSTGRSLLRTMLRSYQTRALLFVAARLCIPDRLASGPRSSAELARATGTNSPSLHRVLRALVIVGVLSEERDGRFGLAGLGRWLRSDVPGSLRGFAILGGEEFEAAYRGLLHTVMTGKTAFDCVFGMSHWEHLEQNPSLSEHFNEWISSGSKNISPLVLASYDFSRFRTVADIGGGHGILLADILQAYPKISGILFDQPHVIKEACARFEEAGLIGRCRMVAGDLFDNVPEGADAHLLKSIVHDWDDERAMVILRNCSAALAESGTLLIIERILPDRVAEDPETVLMDFQMLVMTGGRERTADEYRSLLSAAGFKLNRIIPMKGGRWIIEAVRV